MGRISVCQRSALILESRSGWRIVADAKSRSGWRIVAVARAARAGKYDEGGNGLRGFNGCNGSLRGARELFAPRL